LNAPDTPTLADALGRIAALEAVVADQGARLARLEPPGIADTEKAEVARIAGLVSLDAWFECGDLTPDDAEGDLEAQKMGTMLGKVARRRAVVAGLRVDGRRRHGRNQWRFRLAEGVGLGGL
jgi:hypothetical protein